jgi:hypothetical protein
MPHGVAAADIMTGGRRFAYRMRGGEGGRCQNSRGWASSRATISMMLLRHTDGEPAPLPALAAELAAARCDGPIAVANPVARLLRAADRDGPRWRPGDLWPRLRGAARCRGAGGGRRLVPRFRRRIAVSSVDEIGTLDRHGRSRLVAGLQHLSLNASYSDFVDADLE